MRKQLALAWVLIFAGATAYIGTRRVQGKTPGKAISDQTTQSVVDAAAAFLRTLSTEQRLKVQFAFVPQRAGVIARFHRTADGGVAPGAPAERSRQDGPGQDRKPQSQEGQHADPPPIAKPSLGGPAGGGFGMGPPGVFVGEQYGQAVWSNYPVSDVPRPGLQLGALTTVQRDALMHLLQTVLSPMGYQKVSNIMGSDQTLKEAGTNFASGEAVYTVGIFGEPSVSKPWMIEFGGHHLGLNVVIAGANGVMTPTLTGAQPSVYKRGGETVRVLAKENDTACAFLDALNPAQRKKAILNYQVSDLVLGPGHAGEQIQPEGIAGSELDEKQRVMLLSVISQWAGIVNDTYAKPRLAEIHADLNATYFAWSGPTAHDAGKNGSAYYRIQGPKLVIEFSPQGVGGDPTMHVHTMYRDPTNDYGIKLTEAQ
jgi:Protein of unknown function (DUF3500)